MKLNINGKEVDLIVNGEIQEIAVKKAKLSDKQMSSNEVVRKAKEALEKENEET